MDIKLVGVSCGFQKPTYNQAIVITSHPGQVVKHGEIECVLNESMSVYYRPYENGYLIIKFKVTDQSVKAFAEHCPELQYVGFMGCSVTSKGVIHLTKPGKRVAAEIERERAAVEIESGCGNRESGCGNRESGCGNRESGCGYRGSGCGNRDSVCGNRENGCGNRGSGCGNRDSGCGNRVSVEIEWLWK
ncbi:DnaJ like protein subfamily A member 1 [Tupaia chinensis]|uniref:DnaJ like protein subfamily A member 1 n=1 Tax=Tupaia chinensis TaxID=246437 RepID=L9L4P3_TUPCH|nr:DnaJ like protein subfamily A member 1 [Tupaia chinensis]